jgi:hypothetical protein
VPETVTIRREGAKLKLYYMETLSYTDLPEFKALYKKALREEKNEFLFKNQRVLVSYAKYLIEYLNSRQ